MLSRSDWDNLRCPECGAKEPVIDYPYKSEVVLGDEYLSIETEIVCVRCGYVFTTYDKQNAQRIVFTVKVPMRTFAQHGEELNEILSTTHEALTRIDNKITAEWVE